MEKLTLISNSYKIKLLNHPDKLITHSSKQINNVHNKLKEKLHK